MRHKVEGKKFNRKKGQRNAFLRSLANNVIRKGSITTTEARAKAIRPIVEKAVTLAKKDTLASRRLLISRLHDKDAVEKLIREIAPRYVDRNGGYMRVIKQGAVRKRDGVSKAKIEFV